MGAYAAFSPAVISPVKPKGSLGFQLCGVCNQFMSQSINQLINVILQAGVIGGCGELCTKAFPNSSTEENVCNLLCDVAGVYTFIKLLNKISGKIDTIYFCEELKLCPVHDGGAVKIDAVAVNPTSGPQGTEFAIEMTFTVTNQTGTGEIVIDILPPDGMPPGQYSAKFTLSTQPTEQEDFDPGNYKVDLAICEGQCGAPYPHTALYAEAATNFTVTRGQ